MIKLRQLFHNIDQFGAKFDFPIQEDRKTFKTYLGSISTIAIYVVGLFYFSYLSYLFVTNAIPPNISQVSSYIKADRTFQIRRPLFALQFNPTQSPQEYDKNKVYFQMKASNYHNRQSLIQSAQIQPTGCEDVLPSTTLQGYYCFNPPFEISVEPSHPGQEKYIEINFYACNETNLLPGQYCASALEIKQVQQSYVQLIQFFQEYDQQTKQLVNVGRSYYYFLQQNQAWAFSYQLADYEIDNGLIMQNFNQTTIVNQVSDQSYVFNSTSVSELFSDNNGLILNQMALTLQPQIQKISIQYKKLASVLAEFQSLFSVLLLAGIALSLLSEKQSEKAVLDSMLRRYFPKANQQEIDLLLKTKNHLFEKDTMIKKFRVQEIMSELIELRFIVNLLLTKQQYQQVQNLGLNITEYVDQQKESETKLKITPSKQKYNDSKKRNKKVETELPIVENQYGDQQRINNDQVLSPEISQRIIEIQIQDDQFVDKPYNFLNLLLLPQDLNQTDEDFQLDSDKYSAFNQRFAQSLTNKNPLINEI